MRKKMITTLLCIVLLCGLAGGYYFLSMDKKAKDLAEETPTESKMLISSTKDDLVSATFTTVQGADTSDTISLVPEVRGEEGAKVWVVAGYEDVPLNKSNAENMIRALYELSYNTKVTDKAENLSEYGLEPAKATGLAQFADGTTAEVYVGNETPAKDGYFTMMKGDPALYVINKSTGQKFFNTLNALIDKTVPTIKVEELQHAYINEAGVSEIEIGFNGTEAEKNKELESYGMISLTMLKPYAGRSVYLTNFQENVLSELGSVTLGDLVELSPKDLGQYGLDQPQLEIQLADKENELHLLIGKDADEENVYCQMVGKPYVFLTKKETLQKFYKINPFKLIDRFIALENIEGVEKIEINSKAENYEIYLNKKVIPAEKEGEQDSSEFKPTVNGKEVQEGGFKTYYQALIGLSVDNEVFDFEQKDAPAVTVTYYHSDKSIAPTVSAYYQYNDNFYALPIGEDAWFAVSKQNIDLMFKSINDLLEGKLDK